VARAGVGFGLSYVVGFERELRGAATGDRTFAILGLAAAAVTATVVKQAPAAISGVITGVGFIGGALFFRPDDAHVKGVTTASTIFACAALGIVAGMGRPLAAAAMALLILVALELPHVKVLRVLDARRYQGRFRSDSAQTASLKDRPPRV